MAGGSGSSEDAVSDGEESPESKSPPPGVVAAEPVYEALGHSRRRYLCYSLDEDAEWSLADLATKVAAWENDVAEHAVSDDQREAVYVSLYHTHVPKLVDEGVITFDEDTGTITAAEHAERILSALEGIGASLDATREAHARSETSGTEN